MNTEPFASKYIREREISPQVYIARSPSSDALPLLMRFFEWGHDPADVWLVIRESIALETAAEGLWCVTPLGAQLDSRSPVKSAITPSIFDRVEPSQRDFFADFHENDTADQNKPTVRLRSFLSRLSSRNKVIAVGAATLVIAVSAFMMMSAQSGSTATTQTLSAQPKSTMNSSSSAEEAQIESLLPASTPSDQPAAFSATDQLKLVVSGLAADSAAGALWTKLGVVAGAPIAFAQTSIAGDFALIKAAIVTETGEIHAAQVVMQHEAQGWRIREIQDAA